MRIAPTSLTSKVTNLLYLTQASSDATSQEAIFLASRETRMNLINVNLRPYTPGPG